VGSPASGSVGRCGVLKGCDSGSRSIAMNCTFSPVPELSASTVDFEPLYFGQIPCPITGPWVSCGVSGLSDSFTAMLCGLIERVFRDACIGNHRPRVDLASG